MLATNAALRCTPTLSCRPAAGCRPRRRLAVAVAVQQDQGSSKGPQEPLPFVAAPAEVPDKDPWEGEQFEIVGKIAYAMIPVLVLGAIGVGLFASQTYNEGSTIFLDTPKSESDSARFVPAEQLQAPRP